MINNKGNIYTNCTLVTDLRDISIKLNTRCLRVFFFEGGGWDKLLEIYPDSFNLQRKR